jgi:tetratricopeptide (TPR) repeat protein
MSAEMLKDATIEEKGVWAQRTKNEGNELYAKGLAAEAMEKYTESLAASDLGPEGNIDSLVVPVLCNLAACCIVLEEWQKATLFCQQALELRPNCLKAHLRLGVSSLRQGEYAQSLSSLEKALELIKVSSGSSSRNLSASGVRAAYRDPADTRGGSTAPGGEDERSEERRTLGLIARAKRGLALQEQAEVRQRRALQRVFGGSIAAQAQAQAKNKGKSDAGAKQRRKSKSRTGSGSSVSSSSSGGSSGQSPRRRGSRTSATTGSAGYGLFRWFVSSREGRIWAVAGVVLLGVSLAVVLALLYFKDERTYPTLS